MADNTFDFLGEQDTPPQTTPTSTPPVNDFQATMNSFIEAAKPSAPRRMSLEERLNTPDVNLDVTYVPDSSVEPYRYQEGFDGSMFNPLDTSNQQKYAARETFGSALSKGLDSFAYKFGNTFVDYWKGYGRMADALVNMDWDKMRPDETTLAEQYYKDQIDMKKNFVFQNPEDEDAIFSKRTMSEFISNSGFALGTFAGIGLEIAADIAITAATGGAGAVTFGATAARVAGREGAEAAARTAATKGTRFVDALTDLGKGFSYGNRTADELKAGAKIIEDINQTAKLGNMTGSAARSTLEETYKVFSLNLFNLKNSKNAGEFATNLMKSTPLLGTGIRHAEKLAAASSAGANAAQLIGIGAQGLRRVAQELNMSATEAGFEAVSTYGDTLDKMTQQYMLENDGAIPTADEYEEMRSLALKAGSSNYNTNMGILLATNKLQFGNLFNRFLPASKAAGEIAENLILAEGKTGSRIFKKGLLGAYGAVSEIARTLGKKQAAYQFSKAFAKDFLQFEVSEGLQENLQEMSGSAWKNYYAGKFNGVEMSLNEAFGEGFTEQFSKQGFKTFLMGALTGSIIRIPTAIVNKSLEKTNRAVIDRQYKSNPEANPYAQAEKQQAKDVADINNVFDFTNAVRRNDKSTMTSKMFNFAAQMDAAQEMTSAAQQGLRYEFENGRDNALLMAVASAQRTNSIDAFYRAVKEMGNDMSAEEFEKSFGVKLSDTKYASPQEFSETVARDIKRYADTMEGLRTKLKSTIVEPSQYTPGSREFYIASFMRSAQEEAVDIISMNAAKGEMTADRAKKIADEILSNTSLGSSAAFAVKTLANPELTFTEIGNAVGDLRVLEANLEDGELDAQTRKELKEQIKAKEEEIKLLNKWRTFYEDRQTIVDAAKGEKKEEEDKKETSAKKDARYVFKGKTVDKTYYVKRVPFTVSDSEGKPVDGTSEIAFDPKHEEVIDTFRKIMNLKNKQAGIKTELSEQNVRDAFDKIYDYIRLDMDTRDYMESMDKLMNPDELAYTVARMADGKLKFHIVNHVDTLRFKLDEQADKIINELEIVNENDRFDVYNQLYQVFRGDTFKNLAVFASDPSTGIENINYINELLTQLDKDIAQIVTNLYNKYSKGAIQITQEEYDMILKTGEIKDMEVLLLASKISSGTELTEIEKKVYDIHKDVVDKQRAEFKKSVNETNPSTENESLPVDTEEIPLIGPDGEIVKEQPAGLLSVKEKALQQTQAEYDRLKDDEFVNPEYITDLEDEIERLTAEIAREKVSQKPVVPAPVPATTNVVDVEEGNENLEEETEEQTVPFAVTGDAQQGFDVVDRNKIPVNSDKIKSEEKAAEQAAGLNTTSSDLDFVRELLGDRVDVSDIEKQTMMLDKARGSLKMHNSREKANIETLREYYKTAKGKRLLDAIKESVITGKPVNYSPKKASVSTLPKTTQPTLFETPSSGKAATLTLSSLQKLNAKIKEIREQGLQDPNKMSKFVEKGDVAGAVVTETSILSKLQEITNCFS